MATGTLAVLIWAPGPEPELGQATVAGTMAFVTFVFFQAFNLLNVRSDLRSVFSRETLENRSAFVATAAVVALLVLLVQMDVLHGLFNTTRPDVGTVAGLHRGRFHHPGSSASWSRRCCAPVAGEPPGSPRDRRRGRQALRCPGSPIV